ncbi:hypothetical protein V2G26_014022 [Clonostachys chloroleuca]
MSSLCTASLSELVAEPRCFQLLFALRSCDIALDGHSIPIHSSRLDMICQLLDGALSLAGSRTAHAVENDGVFSGVLPEEEPVRGTQRLISLSAPNRSSVRVILCNTLRSFTTRPHEEFCQLRESTRYKHLQNRATCPGDIPPEDEQYKIVVDI